MAPAGRPRLKENGGRKKRQSKRRSFSYEHKRDVLDHLATTSDIRATIAHFYNDLDAGSYDNRRKLILEWRLDRQKIEMVCQALKDRGLLKNRPAGTATILPATAEEEIVVWINDLRAEGIPISSTMLRIKALDVADANGIEHFVASWSWMQLFRRRHRLSIRARTRQGQVSPPEAARIAAEFADRIRQVVAELGVTTIYNADQTGNFFLAEFYI